MNALLIILALAVSLGIAVVTHPHGAPAILVCAVLATLAVFIISQSSHKTFLLRVFNAALLAWISVGTIVHCPATVWQSAAPVVAGVACRVAAGAVLLNTTGSLDPRL